jgi:hypothetical protein
MNRRNIQKQIRFVPFSSGDRLGGATSAAVRASAQRRHPVLHSRPGGGSPVATGRDKLANYFVPLGGFGGGNDDGIKSVVSGKFFYYLLKKSDWFCSLYGFSSGVYVDSG